MKIKTETIQGENIDIEIDSSGMFSADYDEESYRGKSLEELLEKLKRAVNKSRDQRAVDVTVVGLIPREKKSSIYREEPYVEGDGLITATLRKKHERQSMYLLTADDGTKFQLSSYREGRTKICRRLTPEEMATYQALAAASTDAQAALENWLVTVRVDADELLGAKGGR